MTIDERLQAVTVNLELMSRESETQRENIEALQRTSEVLLETAKQDGENIRALARIAEIHERRLTDLEEQ